MRATMRTLANTSVRSLGLVVVLALVCGLAFAGERIKFKNGHSLTVSSSRVEGAMIYLVLADGSEIGLPKSLVAEVEAGHKAKPVNRGYVGASPRSNSFLDLNGTQVALRERVGGPPLQLRADVRQASLPSGKRLTVGFKYKDSIDVTQLARRTPEQFSPAEMHRQRAGMVKPGSKKKNAKGAPAIDPSQLKLPIREINMVGSRAKGTR